MRSRRRLAVVHSYDDLVLALRQRVDELETTFESVDELAGLPLRYSGKLLGPARARSLGRISLGPLMGALGIEIHVVEAPGFARIRRRLEPRRWHSPVVAARRTDEWRRRRGALVQPEPNAVVPQAGQQP